MCVITRDRWRYYLQGLGNTISMTAVALCIGVVIGLIIAFVRTTWDKNSENMSGYSKIILSILNFICKVYLTVIRGTPVIIQLMIIYYVIFASSTNGMLIGALAFGINSGAYVAEIFRSGIMSIDNGQFEAGRSLGFNYFQTMRYIIMPQAIKNVVPTLANEFIVLLKETSVAGYVAVMDLTKAGDIVRGVTYVQFMPLLIVASMYLIMVMFFTHLVSKLEKKMANETPIAKQEKAKQWRFLKFMKG
ncbi:MAG: amino acid ABC transporter permease [Clostridia bacterium]